MAYFLLFIVNQHGSMVYDKIFDTSLKVGANDSLRLASTFHSMHAIAGKLTPTAPSSPKEKIPSASILAHLANKGITKMYTTYFTLHCYQSFTGLKFIAVTAPGKKKIKAKLKMVYERYSDYVCKNAYQQMDQPIRSLLFDQEIDLLFRE